ncbi:hypothetical protein V5O48_010427 [Marasmius crinis-equi]|uniref:F-box domain-containing protein n=1 Tax=Marasmius crinis-equi TaxID=585013 RepID=A0ABR3F8J2_9AGAR
MKGLSGLPLDDDIVDRILMFSPDFATLKNLILTSKAFHNVFRLHPKSILRAVAYNVLGPALPQALRYVRYRNDADEAATESSFDPDETGEYAPIKAEETGELIQSANMVKEMEKLFSLWYKNFKRKGSVLSFMESLRFQRAMYRILLYHRIFDGQKYLDEHDSDAEDTDIMEKLTKARQGRKKFLDVFSDEHLIQIDSVSRFLVEITRTFSDDATNDDLVDMALSAGPHIIYECYESASEDALMSYIDDWSDINDSEELNPLISGYLSWPLTKLYEERKIKHPSSELLHWKAILDTEESQNETCARCDDKTTKGSSLWGPSTYEFLSTAQPIFGPSALLSYLQGSLRYNKVEAPYFTNLMRNMPPDQDAYDYVIQDILGGDYKQEAFEDWTQNDWLCTSCLTKLLRENLHLWLLNKRIQGGLVSILQLESGSDTNLQLGTMLRPKTAGMVGIAVLKRISNRMRRIRM